MASALSPVAEKGTHIGRDIDLRQRPPLASLERLHQALEPRWEGGGSSDKDGRAAGGLDFLQRRNEDLGALVVDDGNLAARVGEAVSEGFERRPRVDGDGDCSQGVDGPEAGDPSA